VSAFFRLAEQILDVAASPAAESGEHFILFDHAGGMRLIESAGWSLMGLIHEFGAREVFRVDRFAGTVRVEGWSRSEKCLIQRQQPRVRVAPGNSGVFGYATKFQRLPQLAC
jgi:hypothetical protein